MQVERHSGEGRQTCAIIGLVVFGFGVLAVVTSWGDDELTLFAASFVVGGLALLGVSRLFPPREVIEIDLDTIVPRQPDWDDEAGWDAFHADGQEFAEYDPGLAIVPDLRAIPARRLWFPGCGVSIRPRLFAELGFEVVATDFSRVAIEAQVRSAARQVPERYLDALAPLRDDAWPPKPLIAVRHDDRTPMDGERFDAILNIRAFQGFDRESMLVVAQVHFDALKPGGLAVFDTINVQGSHRDDIEDALTAAGFVVPLRETEQWYRRVLGETGIEYMMILGRPRCRDAAQQAVLDSFTTEYRARAEREAEAMQRVFDAPETKVAYVWYSTG